MFLMYLSYLISVLSVHCDMFALNTFITARKRKLQAVTAHQLVGITEHVIQEQTWQKLLVEERHQSKEHRSIVV